MRNIREGVSHEIYDTAVPVVPDFKMGCKA